jgi:hypothetical protein
VADCSRRRGRRDAPACRAHPADGGSEARPSDGLDSATRADSRSGSAASITRLGSVGAPVHSPIRTGRPACQPGAAIANAATSFATGVERQCSRQGQTGACPRSPRRSPNASPGSRPTSATPRRRRRARSCAWHRQGAARPRRSWRASRGWSGRPAPTRRRSPPSRSTRVPRRSFGHGSTRRSRRSVSRPAPSAFARSTRSAWRSSGTSASVRSSGLATRSFGGPVPTSTRPRGAVSTARSRA